MSFPITMALLAALSGPAGQERSAQQVTQCSCDCPQNDALKLELKEAAAVFTGEVIATWMEKQGSSAERLVARIRVEQVWKGVEVPILEVETQLSDCLFVFRKGQQVMVFARHMRGQRLHTSACSPSAAIEKARPVLDQLGPGRRPKLTHVVSAPPVPSGE